MVRGIGHPATSLHAPTATKRYEEWEHLYSFSFCPGLARDGEFGGLGGGGAVDGSGCIHLGMLCTDAVVSRRK